jgi:Family of unknown function (DUF6515)
MREADMKPIFLMMILLALPVSAFADWSNTGMHPVAGPNFIPHQGQAVQHEVHMNALPPRHTEQRTLPVVNRTRPERHELSANRYQVAERREPVTPGYFRRDAGYYGHADVILPYSDVDVNFTVPDTFEAVMVDGQTYYYNEGVFYQQIAGQLEVIPPVLGAVVDYIPQDYQIVMADGGHYLFTGGVFYQRVDQGFEVVEPPVTDQE